MDTHSNHEIKRAAFSVFKKSRKDHLKIDFPTLKDFDIEKRLAGEWQNMSEKEKFPFVKTVEENPLIIDFAINESRH